MNATPDPHKKNHHKPTEEKGIKKNVETFCSYSKSNARDMIAYLLLVFGLIFLFFRPIGGLLIGIVAGAYFSKEIHQWISGYERFVEVQGMARSIILGGVFLALFISAPAIFIGAAIVVGLKVFIFTDTKGT
jgi:hypothetical protein